MPAQIKIPYYSPVYPGVFALHRVWKLFDKADGCKALNNPQAAILMERKPRLLPEEKAAEVTKAAEKRKADAEAAKMRSKEKYADSVQPRPLGGKTEKAPQPFKVSNGQDKGKQPVEECRTPPPFDMLDLPDAMDKMGFTVGAKLARRWFNSRKHEIPNDRHYVYPNDMVDTKIVTLDFILKYPKARAKYDKLINNEIYTDFALGFLKKRMSSLVAKKFLDSDMAYSGDVDTLAYSGGDIQKLNSVFWFQDITVSNFDTLDWSFGVTDLTASLANFSLMTAIANARVRTEKFYNYPKGATPVYCCQSTVEVTHIFVYAKDSYSFADRPGKNASQYLGHWNRNGAVLIPTAVASDLATHINYDIQWGNSPYSDDGFDKPVDLLKGMFGEMRKQDVYYPVRNSDYSKWRAKFNRGGDFAIYTEPKKIKLPTPIRFTLDEICKPAKQPFRK